MVKLILLAKDIPNGTLVTKPTGTNMYRLCKQGIKIYSDGTRLGKNKPQAPKVQILAPDMLLLAAMDGEESFSAVTKDTPLAIQLMI